MCVYFIQPKIGGRIKIGNAKHPLGRLDVIQLGCPIELHIIGVIKDASYVAEQSLHHKFRHLRWRGEWFEPGPELMDYIKENTTQVVISRDYGENSKIGVKGGIVYQCRAYIEDKLSGVGFCIRDRFGAVKHRFISDRVVLGVKCCVLHFCVSYLARLIF